MNTVFIIIQKILIRLYKNLSFLLLKIKWRHINYRNETCMGNVFPIDCVKVGAFTYGQLNVIHYGNLDYKLVIGSYCSIAHNVTFIPCGEHCIKTISTYPFKVKLLHKANYEASSKGNIIVKDDVWIGNSAIILSGVTIGQGAVIGAGSVVTKNVEPYAIVAGNPAHLIKYRFEKRIRERLLNILDYSKLNNEKILQLKDILYKKVDDKVLDRLESEMQKYE